MKDEPAKLALNRKLVVTTLVRLVAGPSFVCALAIASTSQPQIPEPPLPVDPRPLIELISPAEKASLGETRDTRKLVDAYFRISDTHLQAAFNGIKFNNTQTAERELDVYNKAVTEASKETIKFQENKRALSKKIEQNLYRQIKILEAIDQLFPPEREAFSEAALKHAKQLRVHALNQALAAGEMLKDPDQVKKPKSEPPVKQDHPGGQKQVSPSAFCGRDASAFEGLAERPFFVSFPIASVIRLTAHATTFQIAGDYLTEAEDDRVREAQSPDERTKVFMKIADRRLKTISTPASATSDTKDSKKAAEEEREWGSIPKLSRAELLRHYAKAIAECMSKLEDSYERNPKSSALAKGLATLRDSTDRQLQTLRSLQSEMKTNGEIAALKDAIEQAEIANKGARGIAK